MCDYIKYEKYNGKVLCSKCLSEMKYKGFTLNFLPDKDGKGKILENWDC